MNHLTGEERSGLADGHSGGDDRAAAARLSRPGRPYAEPRCGGGSASLPAGTAAAATNVAGVAAIVLWLSSGESIQMRVDDVQAEVAALRERRGRFSGDYVELTGPALGIVRVDAIIAALIR